MRRIIFILMMGLLILPSMALGQNVELVGSFNFTDRASGLYVSGDFVYTTVWFSGLKIIDISNPSNPALMGTYDELNSGDDIFVSGENAFVTDFMSLKIMDVSDPRHPSLAGDYNTIDIAGCVFVRGDYAFVGVGYYGIYIINISVSSNPSLSGYFHTSNYAHDVFVSGNYAYVAVEDSGMQIIDISDPENPSFAGDCHTYGIAVSVQVSGEYAFLGTAGIFSAEYDLNIADPGNPELSGEYILPDFTKEIFVDDNFAYIADDDSGLQIIDISIPSDPTLAASFQTSQKAQNVFSASGYVFVITDSSLLVLRFTPTEIENKQYLPCSFSLSQNYPNPFNARTVISYSLPRATDVTIDIFDIMGRKIETVEEGMKEPGNHEVTWDAEGHSSGIYFYRIKAGEKIETKKMVLMK